jgi:hypothetical protein
MLRDRINDDVKLAMKAQDKLRLSTLRLVNAAIKNADIAAETAKKPAPGDDDVIALMQRMIKQRQESVEVYERGGRQELAEKERGEIEIIRGFLPQQMAEAEAKAAIAEIIAREGATGMKDMGKVMAALKQAYGGRLDAGQASGLVKALLSGG